tara:strand:- start:457 stop:864 length:408 start_codon:yes stop_codon:yes gene_type:complete
MARLQTYERTKIYKDFDLSFSVNPITGDLGTKSDVNAIQQSLKTLINTNFFERPFQPTLGCNIRSLLFEPISPVTANDMKTVINDVLVNYEPRIVVQNIEIRDNSDTNSYFITILYNIGSNKTINTFETILKRLR